MFQQITNFICFYLYLLHYLAIKHSLLMQTIITLAYLTTSLFKSRQISQGKSWHKSELNNTKAKTLCALATIFIILKKEKHRQ